MIKPDIQNKVVFNEFPNTGYMLVRFTDAELSPIIDEIYKIQNDFSSASPSNYSLAGNIKHEYFLKDSVDYFDSIVSEHINAYIEKYDFTKKASVMNVLPNKFRLGNLWVNYQRKHEFNPNHVHNGAISFVLWARIPYKISDEENRVESGSSNYPVSGKFSFLFTDVLGQISDEVIPVDETWNNILCIFPSSMQHTVYPFYTSDDYRITIAGNYGFES